MSDSVNAVSPSELKNAEKPDTKVFGSYGWSEFEKNPRGVSLCRYYWPATTPEAKAVIYLVHGHAVHTCFEFLKLRGLGEDQTYEDSFVQRANEQGFSIAAIDAQGHGRSDGIRNIRCYVDRFQDYVDDVLHFAS